MISTAFISSRREKKTNASECLIEPNAHVGPTHSSLRGYIKAKRTVVEFLKNSIGTVDCPLLPLFPGIVLFIWRTKGMF